MESKNIAVAGTWAFVIVVSIGYFWNGLGTFLLYLILFTLAMIFTGVLALAPNSEKVTQTDQAKQALVAQ
ncbi:MAG: hypothetical protein OK457_03730 [Thaumarchaeota archaeon]|nr:hypothetical protein [Nitrososphaerota archaeon]